MIPPRLFAEAEAAAEKHKNAIAPALQTDYHRQKHAETFLAGANGMAELARQALEGK